MSLCRRVAIGAGCLLLGMPAVASASIWSGSTLGASGANVAVGRVWRWPLDPEPLVVRGFDPPEQRWGRGHRGIDLATRPGQPVLSVASGTVTFAGQVAGRGVVVVDHGTLRSTYEPVRATVHAGQHVSGGAVLGTMDAVGSHCLPETCLHLGARRGNGYVDPLRLLGGAEIRLKPLDARLGAAASAPLSTAADTPGRSRPAGCGLGARMGLTVGGA